MNNRAQLTISAVIALTMLAVVFAALFPTIVNQVGNATTYPMGQDTLGRPIEGQLPQATATILNLVPLIIVITVIVAFIFAAWNFDFMETEEEDTPEETPEVTGRLAVLRPQAELSAEQPTGPPADQLRGQTLHAIKPSRSDTLQAITIMALVILGYTLKRVL